MAQAKSVASAREQVSRPAPMLHPVVYVLGAGILLGRQFLQRTSPSAVTGAIQRVSSWVGVGGGVALSALALLVHLDFRKRLRPTFAALTLRARLARAFAVSILCVLAAVAVVVGIEPSLPQLVLGHEEWALAALIPAVAIAVYYDQTCLKPRPVEKVSIASFQAASGLLRETNDFLLGLTGVEDWKSASGNQRWFLVPEKAMFTNLFALGGIGSGKTAAVLKPLLEQALFKFPHDAEKKVGLLVIDGTKGSLTEHVFERALLAGRANDVVEIKPGGKWSYNPVGEGSATALANKLVAALEVMTAQESHSYYKKMQREFAENAFQILTDVLGPGRFTLRDLYDFICDPQVQKQFLEAAASKNSVSYRWFINQWAHEERREQSQIVKGFRADLSLFVRDELAPTFAVADATFPGWNALLNEGKIVVFNMDLSTWGQLTRAMGIFLLMDFQRAMIARSQPSFQRAGGNTKRLVVCAVDECWAFMNPGIAEFTAVSRESRCCTIGLTQSLGQFPPQYRDTMIGNFRTAIVLPVQDPLTMETYSRLFGTHRTARESTSESTGFSGVQQQLFTDHVTARQGGESRSVSISTQQVEEPRFSPTDLLHLPANSAAVLMFDGSVVQPSRLVKLLPNYLPDFQLLGAGVFP